MSNKSLSIAKSRPRFWRSLFIASALFLLVGCASYGTPTEQNQQTVKTLVCPPLVPPEDKEMTMGQLVQEIINLAQQYRKCRESALGDSK